jgi:hypothetical protein
MYILYIYSIERVVRLCQQRAASVLAQRTLSGEQNKLTFGGDVPFAQGPLLISYCLLRKAIKTCSGFGEALTRILSSLGAELRNEF